MVDVLNIEPTPRLDPIPLIGRDELVEGGIDGAANKQAIAIANNVEYLKDLTPMQWLEKQSGYKLFSKVMLSNGEIVYSDVEGNKNNPNLNMDGWEFDKVISSIARLIALPSPKNGTVKFVKGSQGGWFEYNTSKAALNDGVITYNGWSRITMSTEIFPEWAGAVPYDVDPLFDSTQALQKCLNFSSPTSWDTSVAVMNGKGGGRNLVLEKNYRITDTLWIGAYQTIRGNGVLGFLNDGAKATSGAIIADLDNPNKVAISSSNWKKGGTRVPFNEVSSGASYDAGNVSATHGIKLFGFSVITDKKTHMGVRIQNSPQSHIELFVQGFDYAVMLNASWQSYVNCRTLSYKCGLLFLSDNNGVKFDGYYNSMTGDPLGYHNFLNFFGNDTDTDATWNDINCKFGVVSSYSFGLCSDSVVAEHNDVGVIIASGDWSVQTLYTEINSKVGLGCYTSAININDWVGFGDAYDLLAGANARVYVNGCTKGRTVSGIQKLSQWNSTLEVPINYNHYIRGIKYKNAENVIYVSATGSDSNNGVFQPLLTLDEALSRISRQFDNKDKSVISVDRGNKWTIKIVSEGTYQISGDHSLGNDVSIVSTVANKPNILLNGGPDNKISLSNCSVFITGCNITKGITAGSVENAIFWSAVGENTVSITSGAVNIQSGALVYPSWVGASVINILAYNSSIIGDENAMLVSSNYQNQSPHVVNIVSSQGSIDARITARADKGISVPVAWQGKILGV